MSCLVELPLNVGDAMPGVRDQFTKLAVGEHELQIDQLGESRAYPDHPFARCRLENLW
jgi:hypothetical protein